MFFYDTLFSTRKGLTANWKSMVPFFGAKKVTFRLLFINHFNHHCLDSAQLDCCDPFKVCPRNGNGSRQKIVLSTPKESLKENRKQ